MLLAPNAFSQQSMIVDNLGVTAGLNVSDAVATANGIALNTLYPKAVDAGQQLVFLGNVYCVKGVSVDFSVRPFNAYTIVANGPGPLQSPITGGTTIVQRTDNIPCIKWGGYPTVLGGLTAMFANLQPATNTSAYGHAYYNLSRFHMAPLKSFNAAIGHGIPQSAVSPGISNTIFDGTFEHMESWYSSLSDFDMRNYLGGGTNVNVLGMYGNGGGNASFSVPGTIGVNGTKVFGFTGVSLPDIRFDGKIFTGNPIEHGNNIGATFNSICFEAVTPKNSGAGMVVSTGGYDDFQGGAISAYNCQILSGNLSGGYYLVYQNTPAAIFEASSYNIDATCVITATMFKAYANYTTFDNTYIALGKNINTNASVSSFVDNVVSDGPWVVKELDGYTIQMDWHPGRGTSKAYWTYGTAAPTTGTWTAGSIRFNITPVSGVLAWSCTVAGTPGTWVALTLN